MSLIRHIALEDDLLAVLAEDARLALPETLVLLPNHRACERLKARLLSAGSRFLPTLMPLGELDEVWLLEQAMHRGDAEALLAIPTAADATQCQLHLAQQLAKEPIMNERLDFEQYWMAAGSIWEVFEQLAADGQSPEALTSLSQGDLSEHWRERVHLLRRAAQWWRAYSGQHGLCSQAHRRHLMAAWLAEHWKQHKPQTPVIIAGSTGSQASTLELMRAVLALEQGELWLQGVDMAMLERLAQAPNDAHPQAVFARLMANLPQDVLVQDIAQQKASAKTQQLLEAFRSASPVVLPRDVERIDASDEQEEAAMVALLAKEALREMGKQVAIVLHRPQQHRRVTAALAKEGLMADSAVAQEAASLEALRVWLLLIQAASNERDTGLWLALMKQVGFSATAQAIEKKWLRGRESSQPLLRQLARWSEKEDCNAQQQQEIMRFTHAMQPLLTGDHLGQASQFFASHKAALDALFARPLSQSEGAEIERLESAMDALNDKLSLAGYAAITQAILAKVSVVAKGDETLRLKIYSPIEARLMQADRWILCGLNEGQWPVPKLAHPWLHPFLAQQLHLPPMQASIALSAHDFLTLSAMRGEVFWLRSERVGNVDQLPSRWLERFESPQRQSHYVRWRQYVRQQEMLGEVPVPSLPAPCPPLSARPETFSISALTLLLKDPYGFYAKYILKLKKLEPIDRPPDAAQRGTMVHLVMEKLTQALNDGAALTEQTYRKVVDDVLAQEQQLVVRFQWAPRLYAMAHRIIEIEKERRANHPQVLAEQEYEMTLAGMRIQGRADRVELTNETAAVIDYKTGSVPSTASIELGFEPQLPLLAAMQPKPVCGEMAYWKLSGVQGVAEVSALKLDASEIIDFYREGLEQLFDYYRREDAGYCAVPQAKMAPNYNDYELLSRQEICSSN